MKSLTRQYWKIGVALLAIFISGQALGFVVASLVDRQRLPAVEPLASAPGRPGTWAAEALDRLRGDLALTPVQEEALLPILDATGAKIVRQRERALFQIHLQLLAAHDEMEGSLILTPDQQGKFRASRDTLRRQIDERFAAFLDDAPPPNP